MGEGVSESEFVGGARKAGRGPRAAHAHPSRPRESLSRWSLTLPLTLTGTLAGLHLPKSPDNLVLATPAWQSYPYPCGFLLALSR